MLNLFLFSCQNSSDGISTDFQSTWSSEHIERPWAGGDYWLNPLQAWQQKNGQLQCMVSGGDRNAVLLTRSLKGEDGNFEMQVDIENMEKENKGDGWVGFQIGLQGEFGDYRDDALHGKGFCVGMTTEGQLFIGNIKSTETNKPEKNFRLHISAKKKKEKQYEFSVTYILPENEVVAIFKREVHDSWLKGLVALTCSDSFPDFSLLEEERPGFDEIPNLKKEVGGLTRFAFSYWQLSGEKIEAHPERSYGPIMWCQYTLSNRILKMSAQFAPLGNDIRQAILYVDKKEIQKSTIDQDGNNAIFKINNWDDTIDHEYEVIYISKNSKKYNYKGTVPKDPKKDLIKIASLSCVDDVGFPHHDMIANVLAHEPDLYIFHGDQIYERVGGYGVEYSNKLDYLRKWYVFGWSFKDFLKNRPSIIIPDDHDVFHGNLWGCGGKRADTELGWGYDSQDDGGYKEPPDFINMVHRTQTGHLPDPHDPRPVQNDISVYYTNMNYAGISFAILGDRQWKSAPKYMLPNAEIENGWPQNKTWDAKTEAFHPEAELLGERQELFLENWVADWPENIYFKTVISQSPFCNVATLPKDIYHDKYVPGLPRYLKGGYPPDDRPVADFDSNGWPQNKRNKAVKIIRKAFAIHLTGDQHLASVGQYGADDWGDSGWWASTPAVSNLWPRRWFPVEKASAGRNENDPRYIGNYEDGFGNKITVKAIANPYDLDREPGRIADKAPGYSILEFDKKNRNIKISAWPKWASPIKGDGENKPYEGWPINVFQEENYGRNAVGSIASIKVDGEELIQIYREDNEELVYTLRPKEGVFNAKVFKYNATYKLLKIKNGEVIEELNGLKIIKGN